MKVVALVLRRDPSILVIDALDAGDNAAFGTPNELSPELSPSQVFGTLGLEGAGLFFVDKDHTICAGLPRALSRGSSRALFEFLQGMFYNQVQDKSYVLEDLKKHLANPIKPALHDTVTVIAADGIDGVGEAQLVAEFGNGWTWKYVEGGRTPLAHSSQSEVHLARHVDGVVHGQTVPLWAIRSWGDAA